MSYKSIQLYHGPIMAMRHFSKIIVHISHVSKRLLYIIGMSNEMSYRVPSVKASQKDIEGFYGEQFDNCNIMFMLQWLLY